MTNQLRGDDNREKLKVARKTKKSLLSFVIFLKIHNVHNRQLKCKTFSCAYVFEETSTLRFLEVSNSVH